MINKLLLELKNVIPSERIYTDELRRLAYGTDASFYRLIPKVVIKVKNQSEVIKVIKACNQFKIPITFRAAGTSLSGQAITDSILLLIDRDWNGYRISDNAELISLEPAVIGSRANLYLKPYDKKIGPDPASINSAMIGGIAANNASGMCCGTAQNSYNTLSSMKIIFNDGFLLDTSSEESINEFKEKKKDLLDAIKRLRDDIISDPELVELIKAKYKLKNTTGYSINALVDYDDPIDIIQHLMIGSEGTLGFISEITYKTVPENKFKASALVIFKNIEQASNAVLKLKQLPVDAVEIMDRASLRAVEYKPGMPEFLRTLDDNVSALLIETSALNNEELSNNINLLTESLNEFELVIELKFTAKAEEYSKLWNIRKGLFPSVGAMRDAGTTVVIEDVCFPLEHLADAVKELQSLFLKYGYKEAIIFGHALEGNLHFVFNQNFNDSKEVERYKSFIEDVVKMTAHKYNGSLKAEHGTGRNMAPFVKYEWGEKAYELMQSIKKIFDPENILNPGVIINKDENIHLKNLKPMPKTHDIIDKCIECGFCENVCPSKDLTLTPRQRIVLLRELGLKNYPSKTLTKFAKQIDYDINTTCAVDGLCKLKCPVDINTGDIVKVIRNHNKSKMQNSIADFISGNFALTTNVIKSGLNIANFVSRAIGKENLKSATASLRKFTNQKTPLYLTSLPKANNHSFPILTSKTSKNKVVYFPSCINRTLGQNNSGENKEPLSVVFIRLLNKAGYEVIYPDNLNNLCCGMPFSSKGFSKQAKYKAEQLTESLNVASNNGEYPIVFDTSPCSKTEKDFLASTNSNLKVYDSIEFILDFILPKIRINKLDKSVMLHPVCSAEHMGLTEKLNQIAKACVTNAYLPDQVSCCGFAGDRGFTVPELNESALHNYKGGIPSEVTEGYSSSRTCEIGLSEQTGIDYKSIIYLVDEASKDIQE